MSDLYFSFHPSLKFIPRNTGSKDLIEIAKIVVKDFAYDYVTGGFDSNRDYDNFFEYLYSETDARSGIWAFIVDTMANNKPEYEEGPLRDFIQYADQALMYNSLHEEYFLECIEIILSIEKLQRYHERVRKILKTYEILKEGDNSESYERMHEAVGLSL